MAPGLAWQTVNQHLSILCMWTRLAMSQSLHSGKLTYNTAGDAPFEEPVYTTDANGAHITTHRGKVTEVGYLDGKARDFGYDENNDLVAYKDADGKVYKRDNPSSPWVNSEDGQVAPFSDVTVDQTGKVTVTNADGTTATYDTNNEQVPAATADAPPADSPPADTVETYTVQPGQGFDKIAREVYTQALGHAPTAAEERALSELIAAANNNDRSYSGGVLQPGDELVVPNLQDLSAQAEQQGVPLEQYIRSASRSWLVCKLLRIPQLQLMIQPQLMILSQ